MVYLVDANVLSETSRPKPAATVIEWLRVHEFECVVNPIILGEVQYGILLLPAGRRRNRLQQWFAVAVSNLTVLELDKDTALVWAGLLTELRRKGRTMAVKDSLIAATARQHGLTVATRNVRDYRYAGVAVENPFEE